MTLNLFALKHVWISTGSSAMNLGAGFWYASLCISRRYVGETFYKCIDMTDRYVCLNAICPGLVRQGFVGINI